MAKVEGTYFVKNPKPQKEGGANKEPPRVKPGACGVAGCKLDFHHHHTALEAARCPKC